MQSTVKVHFLEGKTFEYKQQIKGNTRVLLLSKGGVSCTIQTCLKCKAAPKIVVVEAVPAPITQLHQGAKNLYVLSCGCKQL